MTMGPEILAWIWLMRKSPDTDVLDETGSRGAPLRGHFDLDLHLRLQEPGDDEEGGGGANLAEDLAADGEVGVGILGVGDVIGRADDIGHREPGLLQGRFDGLEA